MLISNKFKLFILTSLLYGLTGRFVSSANVTKTLDSDDAILPSYEKIHKVVATTLEAWAAVWDLARQITPDMRKDDRTQIKMDIFPKIMRKLIPPHSSIKSLDWDIRFRRKPMGYLDAILNITTIDQLNDLSKNPGREKFGPLILQWIQLSSAGTQMERFYNKRIRDIINGGTHMNEIINAYLNYNTFAWKMITTTEGRHDYIKYSDTPEMIMKLLYLEDGTDVFYGLRKLTDNFPLVLVRNHFDSDACDGKDDLLYIDPNGADLPFYLLFFLCLVDVKDFVLQNYILLHNNIFYDQISSNENQTELIKQMNSRIEKKIELFDDAMGAALIAGGAIYPIEPGITTCDPPPKGPNDPRRNFTLGDTYEKLTNFIKVFVAPEQELHKSGTCRVTCDMLDVTYSRCGANDTDCQWERERECLLYKNRCDKFNPPCPTGSYRCQNSTGTVTVCPSGRPDRMYEYIKGSDEDAEYHFGANVTCQNETKVYKGGWKFEEDVTMDTPHLCEICTCYCFEPLVPYFGTETTRYFSLRLSQADISKNRAIIGVKLHRVKDQIHIAYADGIAWTNRRINQSTVEWHYPEYETDPKYLIRLSKDMRTMNLDDVVTPAIDRLVTGVRFYNETYMGKLRYNYIGIEIQTHQMDHKGKIVEGSGLYRRNGNSTVNRQRYAYLEHPDTPDDPINAPGITLPDSTSNEFVVFVGTSLEKDAAQSTIPYLDSQKVHPPLDEPLWSWLRGVGIFHKGRTAYGGYLGLKIIEHRFR